MPVTKQAIKKVRQDKRKTLINLKVKQAYKKTVRDFVKKPTEAGLTSVFKSLDKAAKGNVIHKNRASRLKSRLSKKLPKTALKKPSPVKKSKGK